MDFICDCIHLYGTGAVMPFDDDGISLRNVVLFAGIFNILFNFLLLYKELDYLAPLPSGNLDFVFLL